MMINPRSRLAQNKPSDSPIQSPRVATPKRQLSPRKQSSPAITSYLAHLPLLALAISFYAVVYYLVSHFYPAELANIILMNSYLPVQLPFFLANFFLASYLLLNTRRGLMLATLISLLLFLKLQQVIFEAGWLVGLLSVFGIIEVGFTFWHRRPQPERRSKTHE